jgi:CRP-like cAMP-binding protein
LETEWKNLTSLLKSITTFSDSALPRILKEFKRVEVKKNEILLRTGEVCGNFYFVNEGCLRTYFLTSDGQEKTRLIMPSFSIGTALTSFIGNRSSFEFVDSLQNSCLLTISRASFYRLVDESPEWKLFYLKMLEMAYVFQNVRIEHLMSYSASERYELSMRDSPQLFQGVPSKIVASYLDIAPETLSRLKASRS